MQISHGCIQLYPEDIEVLFKKATVGMPVRIMDFEIDGEPLKPRLTSVN